MINLILIWAFQVYKSRFEKFGFKIEDITERMCDAKEWNEYDDIFHYQVMQVIWSRYCNFNAIELVALPCGQICYQCNWFHLVTKFAANANGAPMNANSFRSERPGRCASCNVFKPCLGNGKSLKFAKTSSHSQLSSFSYCGAKTMCSGIPSWCEDRRRARWKNPKNGVAHVSAN